jgi:Phytanoyl-CoA dioxygenase (PhyH)
MARACLGPARRQRGARGRLIEVEGTMDRGLSRSQVEAYRRDGIVFPIAVLSQARAAALRRAYEALEAGLGGRPEAIRWTNLCLPWAHDLTLEPSVLDSVEKLLGPQIIVMGSIILCKHPGHDEFVPWHQDRAYAGPDEGPSVSAWVALADSTVANGCMRVIPGSHGELLAHHDVPDPRNLLRAGRSVAAVVDEGQAVDVVLRAGEMSLHHDRIVHGSQPNCGEDKRIGFVIRYTTPATRGRGFPMVRARGMADCSHLEIVGRPPDLAPGESLGHYLRYREAMERITPLRSSETDRN